MLTEFNRPHKTSINFVPTSKTFPCECLRTPLFSFVLNNFFVNVGWLHAEQIHVEVYKTDLSVQGKTGDCRGKMGYKIFN